MHLLEEREHVHEGGATADAAAQLVERQVVGAVVPLVLGGAQGHERGAAAAHEVDVREGAGGRERRGVEEEHALVEPALLLCARHAADERRLERLCPKHHHLVTGRGLEAPRGARAVEAARDDGAKGAR